MNVRDQVVRFLKTHPSINAVNFRFKSYRIWPDAYRKDVADAVSRGDIKLGSAVNDDAAASYRQDQDRLEISPSANFASLHHLGLILHECTHAVLDMRAIGRHSAFEDEAVAYLAQAFFLTRTLGDARTTPDIPVPSSANTDDGAGIYREAKRVAARAMRTGTYAIDGNEGANLISLIAGHPHYRDQKSYPSNRFNRSFLYNLARNI
ncbi:hypothetical protein [Frateuria sp. STR12]|uniref:hypothetical protein n=1 Tax=Frateuria hangzhouensis TaxID=2995589 RepID=UPI0022609898|nr:hypothetical protein [Frateuria sp. STR12]MCX7514752.1 hypothetical protein [Frateuria sp. STR12]